MNKTVEAFVHPPAGYRINPMNHRWPEKNHKAVSYTHLVRRWRYYCGKCDGGWQVVRNCTAGGLY